eukprot:m.50328 g.50328  ORF g.50328 m.50328 type:complete len:980 (-) comp12537_c0_seq1:324-3263(-)
MAEVEVVRDAITQVVIEDFVLYQGKYYERHIFEEWFQKTEGSVPEPEPIPDEELERLKQAYKIHRSLALDAQNGLDLIIPASLKSLIQKKLIGADYDAPDVIVVGKESDGKSLTLSRIIVRPIFPFRDNICTLMPVKVMLRTAKKATIPKIYAVEIKEDGTRVTVPTTVTNHTGPNRGKIAQVEVDYVPLNSLQHAIDERMIFLVDQLEGNSQQQSAQPQQPVTPSASPFQAKGKISSKPYLKSSTKKKKEVKTRRNVSLQHEIIVEMAGPEFPNITLVDLPGIVSVDVANQDLPARTRELAQRYLRSRASNSFICAVVSAQQNITSNDALQLLQETNMISNTICIISKTDLIQAEELKDMRFGSHAIELGYGYCLVANHVSEQERLHMDLFRALEDREKSTREKVLTLGDFSPEQRRIIEESFGIHVAQDSLRLGFETYLCRVWTKRTEHALRRSLALLEQQLDDCGYPYLTVAMEADVVEQRARLRQLEADIGSLRRGEPAEVVKETVLAQVRHVLSTTNADDLLSVQIGKLLADIRMLFRFFVDKVAAVAPVPDIKARELREDARKLWIFVHGNLNGFAQQMLDMPASAVVVDTIIDEITNPALELKLGRFSAYVHELRDTIGQELHKRVDILLHKVTTACIAHYMDDFDRVFEMEFTPEGLWKLKVSAFATSLVSSLAFQLFGAYEPLKNLLPTLVKDVTELEEDESRVQERSRILQHMNDVCDVLCEIHTAQQDFMKRQAETNQGFNATQQQTRSIDIESMDLPYLDKVVLAELVEKASKSPVLKTEVTASAPLTIPRSMSAEAVPGDHLLERLTIPFNKREDLANALYICRHSDQLKHLTLQSTVLSEVTTDLARVFSEMYNLCSLTFSDCDLSNPQVIDTIVTGLERNTTLNQLTIERCTLPEDLSFLDRVVAENTTLQQICLYNIPLQEEDQKRLLDIAASRVPFDYHARKAWSSSDRIRFVPPPAEEEKD